MLSQVLTQLMATGAALAPLFLAHHVVKGAVGRLSRTRRFPESRVGFAHKLAKAFFLFLGAIVLLSIWGIDAKNLWISATSLVGIIAIGFFAVGSILSNIIAGFILVLMDAFRIGDKITVLPEAIEGRLVEFN